MFENDDLLAELNGGVPGEAATPKEGEELVAATAATKRDPLVVAPPPRLSAVQKFERASMDKAGDNRLRGYAVTVGGFYSAPSVDTPGRKVKRPYTLTVNLPSTEGALSVIKNKMLDKMLRVKYRDYVTYLTHEITDVRPLGPDTPESNNIAYMSFDALRSFVTSRGVPLVLNDYGNDARSLRAAVTDWILNPKEFVVREKKRLEDQKLEKELDAMNPTPQSEGANG
jgi:hypothetical protein